MISELITNYLIIILLNFLFLITTYSIGLASNNLLSTNLNKKNHILWLGIITLSVVLMTLHFIFSISYYLNLLILVSSIIHLIHLKKFKITSLNAIYKSNIVTIIFYFSCLIILTKASLLYDTGLYHIQTIKWFNEYSLIPGLANLNDRFGFNIISYYLSNYLIYPYTENLSFISVSLFVYTLTFFSIINLKFDNFDKSQWLKIILLIGLAFKRYLVPSASPDLIVFCLELIIISTLIDYIYSQNKRDDNLIFILLALCFVFYFKISTIIFSLLFIFVLIYFYRDKFLEIINYKIVLFILVPFIIWIIRGYILSGMPFYPNSTFIIDNFIFSVEKEHADTLVKNIYNWSVNSSIKSEVKISFLGNLIYWFKNVPDYHKLYLLIISILLILIFLKFEKKVFTHNLIIIMIVLLLNIFFVLINLPQVRFLESSLIGLILLLIILFYQTYRNFALINNIIINKILMLSSVLFFIFVVFFKGEFNNTFSVHWNSSKVLNTQNYKILENNKNFKVFMPISGDQCWNSQLPCTFDLKQNLTQKKIRLLNKDFFYFTIK